MRESQIPPANQPDASITPSENAGQQPPDRFLDESAAPAHHPPTNHQRTLAATLYLLTTSLLFADQNLLSPNLSLIAAEFHLTDQQRDAQLGGDIAIAFFMVGVPASLLVGCLADAMDRRGLLFLGVVLVGEGACMATYWVQTYRQLYWCRAVTGCSVGGALPLMYSVLGDYYGPGERGWVSGAIGMGCGIGISLGQGVAGFLGPRFGWRMPFLVVSIPAVMGALMVWLCVGEVERGGSEKQSISFGAERRAIDGTDVEHHSLELTELGLSQNRISDKTRYSLDACKQRRTSQGNDVTMAKSGQLSMDGSGTYVKLDNQDSTVSDTSASLSNEREVISYVATFYDQYLQPHFETLKALVKCPSVLLAIFQGAPGCVPWGIVNTYLNDYLSSDRGLSIEGATLVILIFGIGNFAGTSIGGIGSSHIYAKYGPRYTALLSGGAAIAGCLPMWALINYDSNGDSRIILWLISLVAGALSAITGPIVKSTLQNVTQPQMRGMAFALLTTFDDFGRGLGPAFVAWMIGKLDGRRKAFNVGIAGWVLCGILNGMLYFTVERDEERARMHADRVFNAGTADRGNDEPSKDKVRGFFEILRTISLHRVCAHRRMQFRVL
eukprot:CCRYP_006647-RA/>CCRYP_006647-RA protein AED:0.03 eAED:0.03 QI:236/1/1/1/1/1/5/2686/610